MNEDIDRRVLLICAKIMSHLMTEEENDKEHIKRAMNEACDALNDPCVKTTNDPGASARRVMLKGIVVLGTNYVLNVTTLKPEQENSR